MKKSLIFTAFLCFSALAWMAFTDDKKPYTSWGEYLGDGAKTHYSALNQINTENVKNLKVAWEYHSQDSTGQIQCNPIIVDGVLYATTASVQVIALDAATGKQIWKYQDSKDSQWFNTSRGVTYWADGNDKRIYFTAGKWLFALNAQTGKLIETFADKGRMDLHNGLAANAQDKFICSNTPGTIYKDLIIMPFRFSEGPDAAPGHIRAFDVRTGQLAWMFKTIPHPGEAGYETWGKNNYKNTDVGAANNWAGMAIDRERGIVYVPTGSAGYDFYGGNRPGKNLYANCLLALDAATGKRKWHFQFVHHDVWDRDLPSTPNLVTITRNGADGRPRRIDAVAQITKSGFVFVFDRVTGKSLFPIKEIPVFANAIEGEKPWPTQPIPLKPAPFSRQTLTEAEIGTLAENKQELVDKFRTIRHKNQFELPSREGTLIFPGYDGGGEWGGPGYDPQTGILYVNSNEMPWIMTMVDKPKADQLVHLTTGERVYVQHCVVCHGNDRKGNIKSGYPSLLNLPKTRTKAIVEKMITNGKAMMPGFSYLSATDKEALIAFLYGEEKKEVTAVATKNTDQYPSIPYKTTGYNKFLDKNGYPAISPPWGQLTAIDLNTGEKVWQKTFGELKELTAKGIAPTGCENYGGPVITAGGLLMIAATKDGMFRAYNKKTGELLYETKLPAAGFATPSTYQIGGKQYVVIACGGTKLGTPKGDSYVAFALP